MVSNEIKLLIQRTNSSCQFFLLNFNTENNLKLNDLLSKLNCEISNIEVTARLTLKDIFILDFLCKCKQLLSNEKSNASIRSKICLIIFNLALYNIEIRKFISSDLQFCGFITDCLKFSILEQLGPQNLIDILRLIQVLTYEKSLSLGTWSNDLITFLTSEIIKFDNTEIVEKNQRGLIDHPLPYFMTILSNLVSCSNQICVILKKMNNFKQLCKRFLEFLQNNSRTVVVCSLSLIEYLDEKIRDTIFSPQNISQTFLCIFNVLSSSDSLMTIHTAVNLLKRIVVSESAFGYCSVTSIAKNLISYQFFEKSIQRIAILLITFDPRSEESEKIFDLLLLFCKINDFKKAVCLSIIKITKCEKRLTTPTLSICRIAGLCFSNAFCFETSLNALQLLTLLVKEAIDANIKLDDFIPTNSICDLIECCIKSAIETKSDLINFQCARITGGLKLAKVVSNDDNIRNNLLSIVNASLCAHINESQLISNPIVSFINNLQSSTTIPALTEDFPDWCLNGVSISLQLLLLLATLKDYSKLHKDLYWKSLKDERLIPFIAFAISCGDDELVYNAFVLFTHCTQIQEFSIRMLSDIVAMCSFKYKFFQKKKFQYNTYFQSSSSSEHLDNFIKENLNNLGNFDQLDELLDKMKKGIDLKDIHTSELVCAFEKKIAMYQIRERELKQILNVKEQTFSQSERLCAIWKDLENGDEIANMRIVMRNLEQKLDESIKLNTTINLEKNKLIDQISTIQHDKKKEQNQYFTELNFLKREKEELIDENKKENELQAILRQRFDELSSKFVITSNTLLEMQQEIDTNVQKVADAETKSSQFQKLLSETNLKLENVIAVVEKQRNQLIEKQKEIEKLLEENKKLLKIKQTMVQMLND